MRLVAWRWLASVSFLLGFVLVPSTPALAQGAGVRGGISVDPDQFYVGGHYETSPLIDRVHFRPNVEIGFGDDLTLLSANMEFVYKFTTRRDWNIYAGGGPALNVVMVNDNSDTDAGLNILVGVEQRRGMFFEFKLGAIDSPDFKFGVGYT